MEAKPVKIFSTVNVPRLKYIADLVLNEILGLSWEIVTDKRKLGKCPVINYSGENIPGAFRINPVPLLFETGIKPQEIKMNDWKGLPVFFQSSDSSDLPFDIFAASFYLVTRYEEYGNCQPDEYGRYMSSSSLAFKNRFLDIPVVDLWAKELSKALVNKFQTLTCKHNEFRALITFDIDEAFAYLGKDLFGNIGAFLHDFTSGSKDARHRLNCLTKGERDPYEVYDYLVDSCNHTKSDTKFFFPVGNNSDYDKNPNWKNDKYRNLIRKIANEFSIGLHPSFRAATNKSLINTELQRLRTILNKDCYLSRFHFLRITMPLSYDNLNKAGIREDYSMGYPDECGFRAGIGRPFMFYNLIEDKVTNLRVFPFQIMDIALNTYKKMEVNEAKDTIRRLILQIKKVGGLFISVWHNTSLLDTSEGREWRDLFEFTLKEQVL